MNFVPKRPITFKISENGIQYFFFKGQLQRFDKSSLFDRFRHVENGLDINF